MTLMKISQKGIDLIKRFEGCKLYAYRDSVGVPSIGFGHTKGVKMGMSITQSQAESFLKDDLKPCEQALNRIGVNFTQNQFDALVSWIFNLGEGNFNASTLKKKILVRAASFEIADQIVRWVNAGGKVQTGLQKRRIAEANMYIGHDLYYLDKGVIKRKV